MQISPAARAELVTDGKLRIGLNYGNFLLVLKDGPDGQPRGIAPDFGAHPPRGLAGPVRFSKYERGGTLADAVKEAAVDVGFLGAEPQRANEIAFTSAYLEIPVTFLVPAGSPIKSLGEVDRKGVRVAVADRSAYDLFLS